MITTEAPALASLAETLESPKCYCGETKKIQHAFCHACYSLLARQHKQFIKLAVNYTNSAINRAAAICVYRAYDGVYNAALDLLAIIKKEKQNVGKS